MKGFWLGLAVGVIGTLVTAGWLMRKVDEQPVMFPGKNVYDAGDSYHFEGSIYGAGEDAPINNFVSAWCRQATMECELISIDALDGTYVGAPYENTIKVRSWGEREIVADSQGTDPGQCNWFEIKIDRATEEIAYTRIPNKNPNREICKEMTEKVYRWSIDNGRGHAFDDDGTKRN